MALDDRLLADIGLSRGEVMYAAWHGSLPMRENPASGDRSPGSASHQGRHSPMNRAALERRRPMRADVGDQFVTPRKRRFRGDDEARRKSPLTGM